MILISSPRGFSLEARYAEETARSGVLRLRDSNALGFDGRVESELARVWMECQRPDWDGFGARPVLPDTLHAARQFLQSFPLGFPPPSIGAEPDGQITFDWHRSPRRTLSVSVSPDGNLHFAALFGASREFGTEAFFGQLPQNIERLIGRVYTA